MKKKKHPRIEDFGPVLLYWEDLELIYASLSEISGQVKISTANYEMDTLQELREVEPNVIQNVTLYSHEPGMFIKFSSDELRVFIEDDTSLLLGVFQKVKTIIHQRRSWTVWLGAILSKFIIPVAILGLIYFQPMLEFFEIPNVWYYRIPSSIPLLLVIALMVSTAKKCNEKLHCRIYATNKVENPNFIKRNRDKIILSAIFLIIGSILTIFTTILIEK